MTSSRPLLMWCSNIHTKIDIHIASKLRFESFTYTQKDNEIIFLMQLMSCQNSFGINRNHWNNIPIIATDMMMSSHPLLLWHGNIHTKMDVQVTSKLSFRYFTYVQKDSGITYSMQLVTCQNSSRINRNHRNNVLTVATGMMTYVITPVATMTW
jgi:hypothetical protein